jgi:putative transposase
LSNVACSVLKHVSAPKAKDGPAIEAIKRVSGMYSRDGHRRIRIFVGREGHSVRSSHAERL